MNLLISRLSPSVGEIPIRELGFIAASFHERKPHLHNWVSGGTFSGWQLASSGLKMPLMGQYSDPIPVFHLNSEKPIST